MTAFLKPGLGAFARIFARATDAEQELVMPALASANPEKSGAPPCHNDGREYPARCDHW